MKTNNRLIQALCLVVSLLFLSPSWAQAKVHGVFRVVKGDVKVKTARGKIKKARVGVKVFPKDTIITKKDSRAKIVMIDKNVINVSPESQVVFQKYDYSPKAAKKNVLLNVIYGKVRSKVNQKYDGKQSKFQVKTPSAVAGVRGTDFFTSFNQATKATQVVTFEGEVKYGLPGPGGSIVNAVSVRAGQAAVAAAGRAPQAPKPMPKNEIAKLDSFSDADKAGPAPTENRTPAEQAPNNNRPQKKDKEDGPKKGDRNNGPRGGDQAANGPAPGGAPAAGSGNTEGNVLPPKNDRAGNNGPKNGRNDRPRGIAGSGPATVGPGPSGPDAGFGPDGGFDPAMGGPAVSGPNREPAFADSGMMMDHDFAHHDGGGFNLYEGSDDLNLPGIVETPRDGIDFTCEFCNETVQSGNTRLIINVIQGN